MDSLDKIIIQEANRVTPDDYKRLTGTSLEESMARMKKHMAAVKARTARAESDKMKKPNIVKMDMRYAVPMAASAKKKEE